ncbi:hypothetical protein BBP40_003434 [Aspergillus hancockii]|nr:hypothetical protein BBP40_003434 [Aspergillus hancockii]
MARLYVDSCMHMHSDTSELAGKTVSWRQLHNTQAELQRHRSAKHPNAPKAYPTIPLLFVIICTILCVYYSLKSLSNLSIALGWADRECFVAAIVASMPGIKPLFRNARWLGSSNRARTTSKQSSAHLGSLPSKLRGGNKTFISSSSKDTNRFELLDRQERSHRRPPPGNSEECILDHKDGAPDTGHPQGLKLRLLSLLMYDTVTLSNKVRFSYDMKLKTSQVLSSL